MRRKLWIIAMGSCTALSMVYANQLSGQNGEGCMLRGEHVDPHACAYECCAGSCNGCASDGHYICG
jgi:hypothetical protein